MLYYEAKRKGMMWFSHGHFFFLARNEKHFTSFIVKNVFFIFCQFLFFSSESGIKNTKVLEEKTKSKNVNEKPNCLMYWILFEINHLENCTVKNLSQTYWKTIHFMRNYFQSKKNVIRNELWCLIWLYSWNVYRKKPIRRETKKSKFSLFF